VLKRSIDIGYVGRVAKYRVNLASSTVARLSVITTESSRILRFRFATLGPWRPRSHDETVATAIATFVSTDKFIIFPAIIAAIQSPPFWFLLFTFLHRSNFGVPMDARRRRRKEV